MNNEFRESIQIVLYTTKDLLIPVRFANEIASNIKKIGQPIILPTFGQPDDMSVPSVVFQENPEIQIMAGNINTALIFFDMVVDYNTIKKVVTVLKSQGLAIERIGMIINKKLKEVEKFKTSHFLDKNVVDAEEFQFGWNTIKTINNLKVNFWERYFNNPINGFTVSYDINTLFDNKLDLDENTVEKFIEETLQKI